MGQTLSSLASGLLQLIEDGLSYRWEGIKYYIVDEIMPIPNKISELKRLRDFERKLGELNNELPAIREIIKNALENPAEQGKVQQSLKPLKELEKGLRDICDAAYYEMEALWSSCTALVGKLGSIISKIEHCINVPGWVEDLLDRNEKYHEIQWDIQDAVNDLGKLVAKLKSERPQMQEQLDPGKYQKVEEFHGKLKQFWEEAKDEVEPLARLATSGKKGGEERTKAVLRSIQDLVSGLSLMLT